MIKKIELTEIEKDHIKAFVENIDNATTGFNVASAHCREANGSLWEELFKMYPQVKGNGARFNHKELLITYHEDAD